MLKTRHSLVEKIRTAWYRSPMIAFHKSDQIAIMERLRAENFGPRLSTLAQGIEVQSLSRLPASRLEQNALPNIGQVDLVSADSFERDFQPLYVRMFHGGERERPELIVQRLRDDFAGEREGLSPYRVIGIKDPHGNAIGGAQFSVLSLSGTKYVVPYLQYIYVRPEVRRQDLSEVLHTLVLVVATADAAALGKGRIVPFTLFETDPPNHGNSEASRTYATERSAIHTKTGSTAMMLVDCTGHFSSPHVQPGLEPGHSPYTVVWVIRPSPAQQATNIDLNDFGLSLLEAYYRSLREEGFPEENIKLAEDIARSRCVNRKFVEKPLAAITPAMYREMSNEATQALNLSKDSSASQVKH